MFANLSEVDWVSVGTPDMRMWLEGMASHDMSIRENAYDNFYDSGVVDLNKATPYVIPFVIKLLSVPNVPKEGAILQLLIVLASESLAYSDHPKLFELARLTFAEISKGRSVFETYVEKTDTKELAQELLGYLDKPSLELL
jgi:hypothetical protein